MRSLRSSPASSATLSSSASSESARPAAARRPRRRDPAVRAQRKRTAPAIAKRSAGARALTPPPAPGGHRRRASGARGCPEGADGELRRDGMVDAIGGREVELVRGDVYGERSVVAGAVVRLRQSGMVDRVVVDQLECGRGGREIDARGRRREVHVEDEGVAMRAAAEVDAAGHVGDALLAVPDRRGPGALLYERREERSSSLGEATVGVGRIGGGGLRGAVGAKRIDAGLPCTRTCSSGRSDSRARARSRRRAGWDRSRDPPTPCTARRRRRRAARRWRDRRRRRCAASPATS